jgi:hypothetical protein
MARGGIEYEQTHPTTVLDALKAVAPPSSKAAFLGRCGAGGYDHLLQAICPCRRARFVGSIAIMLTPVICPSCHHTGAIDSARLPRILTCVCCGHSDQFEAPLPNRLTREQRASDRARRRAYETGELVRSLLST